MPPNLPYWNQWNFPTVCLPTKSPRAALSHSASVGSRLPTHCAYAIAAYQLTYVTGDYLYLSGKYFHSNVSNSFHRGICRGYSSFPTVD